MSKKVGLFTPLLRRIEDSRGGVEHVTLDLTGPGGVARLHLMPPRFSLFPQSSMLVINGKYRMPLDSMQAMLVRQFMRLLSAACTPGEEISDEEVQKIVAQTVAKTSRLYPEYGKKHQREQLEMIMRDVIAFAREEPLPEDIHFGIGMDEWRKMARAPERMDLIIAPISRNGHKACPNDCGVCFADVLAMDFAPGEELTFAQWVEVIRKCRKIGIPELTFTGGEPTTQPFLVDLVREAQWAVTRLNTAGMTMTKELARALFEASLDAVQFTYYSLDEDVHNALVGAHSYRLTVQGIRNALDAGLNVSCNIPLLAANAPRFLDTIAYLKSLGVRYITCSGIIMAGSAKETAEQGAGLTHDQLLETLRAAKGYADTNDVEIQFTHPGDLDEDEVEALGLDVPQCGACLSNMAVLPNGAVVPCQSWIKNKKGLGNILRTPWWFIWNNRECVAIRNTVALTNYCALGDVNQ